ncbi:hypothetical protein ACQY0O_006369 [Thecaphora frezii]
MEAVMRMYGDEALFAGKMPENVDESIKSLLLMMGYSAGVWESQSKRGLEDASIVLCIFYMGSDERHATVLPAIKEKDETGETLEAIQKRRKHKARKFSLLQLCEVLRGGLEVERRPLRFDTGQIGRQACMLPKGTVARSKMLVLTSQAKSDKIPSMRAKRQSFFFF